VARDLPAAADIGTRVAAHRVKQEMKVSALAREAPFDDVAPS
jgi:hypothetical protein